MFRKLILVSAISMALLPQGAAALGLGAMRAQTALNQPFVGEIDLLDARPDELDTVKVRLAAPEAFAEVGAERFHYLTKLRFVPQLSERGRPVVRVTSDEPVREPYMDLLVEVLWPTGRLVREYTVLLDLPSTTARPAPRVAPPPVSRPAAPPAPRPSPQRPVKQRPQAAPAATGRTDVARTSADGFPLRYGPVPAGKGLWQVARRIAPAGATVPQTAMALYRNNQHAFAAGDINRLLVHQRLEIPSKAELLALDPAAAESEFQAAISGRKVRRTPLTDAAATAAQEGPTQLKIAGTGAGRPVTGAPADDPSATDGGGIGDIEQELLLVREAGESTRQETDHLHGRIRQLEAQLADIQRLLTLRNQQLALLQLSSDQEDGAPPTAVEEDLSTIAAVDAAAAPDASVDQATGSADATSFVNETGELFDTGAAARRGEGAAVADDEPQVAEAAGQDALDASLAPPSDADGILPDQSVESDEATIVLDEAGVTADVEPAAVTASSDAIEPPSFLDSLPLPLPWLGAGAAALGLGGLLTSVALRRRRREAEERDAGKHSRPSEESESAEPAPAEASQQPSPQPLSTQPDVALESPPTDDADTFSSPFDTGFPLEEDSDDTDVLAEADIYIAYGRYREAEALLKEELTKYPGRVDLQFKLAEAYYGAGDGSALDALSDQMQYSGVDRQDKEEWARLVSMKQALEERDDGRDEPPAISSFSMPSSVPTGGVGLDTFSDRAMEHAGTGGQEDRNSGFASDLGLELSPVSDPAGAPSTASAPVVDEPAAIEEMDLDIIADEPVSIDKADAAGDTFDLESPFSETLGLPTRESDAGVTAGTHSAVDQPESAKRQETADELASYLADTAEDSVSTHIQELNDDDLSSELLSSQWQMDSGAWDEIGTKMELALAYMDMDDHDGARAILEEIKREGNDAQRAEAGELLAKLP